jgi:hypothetical protein
MSPQLPTPKQQRPFLQPTALQQPMMISQPTAQRPQHLMLQQEAILFSTLSHMKIQTTIMTAVAMAGVVTMIQILRALALSLVSPVVVPR